MINMIKNKFHCDCLASNIKEENETELKGMAKKKNFWLGLVFHRDKHLSEC